jgi:ribonuclease R
LTELSRRVVKALREADKPLSLRELVRTLDLEADDRRALKAEVQQLLDDGRLAKAPGARLSLPTASGSKSSASGTGESELVIGRLTCNPAGFGFVVPERAAEGPQRAGRVDVYVAAGNLKDALHGDRVAVRVDRVSAKGIEGHVVKVLERGLTRIVGRLDDMGRVVPFDKRVLHELSIPSAETGGATVGQMVLAEITRPPTGTRSPVGRVLEVLGNLEDPGVDLKVVMAKYGLPDAFPVEVEREAESVPTVVSDAERAGRTDFRPWHTVTVDPETARDHDDAISLDRMDNGNWLLAVHIADVAHYVVVGTTIDQEAYLRGTSVYFPDRVVPMLPHALSSGICSLLEGQDRLTQSVVLELDQQGHVVRSEYHDGVIRVAAKLSYQQAQAIVDGDAPLRTRYATVVPLVERMDQLAKVMRKRRYERGALDLDMPEPKLVLDAQGQMTAIVPTERLDSMRTIEEFMLAANEAVAERLDKAGIGALYRIHEQPDPGRVEEFCDLAATFGYRLPPNFTEVRPQDFQAILRQIHGKPEEKLISYLLLRTMKLARYHEDNLGHFGLATEMYAHFTSPIRRYPDLVVHRGLRALREGRRGDLPPRETLADMGRHLSDMERRAMEAERELVEWKKVRFMSGKLGEIYNGYVTGVQTFGLFVELDEVYVQGLVHVSSMGDDFYVYNDKAHVLKGENSKKVYRLGDRVKIQVVRVDLERRQIDFALADVLERTRAGARKSGPPRSSGAPRSRARRR